MHRFAALFALMIAAGAIAAGGFGQTAAAQDAQQLAARCGQLAGLYDRYVLKRSEGSGGSNLERLGATIDCDRGRYDKGIKQLEDILRRNKIPIPA